MRTAAELTLGNEPDAVPKARRFVATSLGGEAAGTVHTVELVVTELVTNAFLHGRPPVHVSLIHLGDAIRVEVEDTAAELPVQAAQHLESMTGRGLRVVAGLSSRWGFDAGRGPGKVVWSELPLGDEHPIGAAGPEITPEAVVASQAGNTKEPTYTVRLSGVPTSLLLAAKTHIDDVVRELTLLRGGEKSSGANLPPAIADLVRSVTEEFAGVRAEIKRQALAAAARGETVADLVLHLPLSAADAGEHYLAALDEADQYARGARLLTLAPPLSHQAFRRWYVRSLVAQLRSLGAGRVPDPPEPLPAVLAARLDELEESLRRVTGS